MFFSVFARRVNASLPIVSSASRTVFSLAKIEKKIAMHVVTLE